MLRFIFDLLKIKRNKFIIFTKNNKSFAKISAFRRRQLQKLKSETIQDIGVTLRISLNIIGDDDKKFV